MAALTEVAPLFVEIAHRIVWCTVATVGADLLPRTRVLHPLWEWDGDSLVGWVATAPTPLKRRHLDESPSISLTYWDPGHDTATADCWAEWVPDSERSRLWDRFASAPAPVGYDPSIVPAWSAGPDSAAFSGWRLDPFRLRVLPAGGGESGPPRPVTWSR